MADPTLRIVVDPSGAVAGGKVVDKSLRDIRAAFGQTDRSMKTSQASFSGFGRSLVGALGITVGLTAVVGGLRSVIDTGRVFQKSISELSAITGATGQDLDFLSDRAKLLGRTTTLSASEVATGFKLIASAKPDLLESGEALAEVTEQAITLAEAAGLTLPQAAAALGNALNQFEADAEDAGRFINVLAAGSQKGASEIPELTQALKVAGTVAANAGISFEETVATIETLGEVGLKGAEAGTIFRNVVLRLQKEGIESLDPAVQGLRGALKNLNAEQRSSVDLIKLFRTESFAGATALLNRIDRTEELQEAITGTNIAEQQAIINTSNLDGKMKQLNSAVEGLQIALSDGALPGLEDGIGFFAQWINVVTDATEATNTFADNVGRALGGIFETNRAVLEDLEGATVGEIEDRVRQENQILNSMLEANSGVLDAVNDIASLGFNEASQRQDIAEQEVFIAKLIKLAEETKALQNKNDTDAAGGDEDVAEAKRLAEAAAKAAKERAEAEKEAAKEAAKNAREQERLGKQIVREATREMQRAASQQESAFTNLQSSLDPLGEAQRQVTEGQRVLNEQFRLGKIDANELQDFHEKLAAAFADSLDPLTALQRGLDEEREALMLSADERAVDADVRRRTQTLAAQGIELTETQVEELRNELTAIQELTAQQQVQQAVLESIQGPQEEMNEQIAALNDLLDDGTISLTQFNEKMGELRLQTLEGQTSVEAGFERGFIKAQEQLNDFASLSEKIVTDSFQGMEDGIVNFAKTGKLEFSSLVDQILEDIVRLEARRALSSFFGAPGQNGKEGSGLFGFLGGGGSGEGTNESSGGGGSFAQLAGIATSLFALRWRRQW
jgi:TP901 family phage tail tape measure protein/lambda family phage tail tape measure protein